MPKVPNKKTSNLDQVAQTPDISLKKYRTLKAKLKKIESSNYDSIFLIPCNGNQGWYELAEHSALIYYYKVCQPLNLKTKFIADTLSFYDQYKLGYVRAKGVDNVRANLEKQGLLESESKQDEMYIFKLKTPYSPKEIADLAEREHHRRIENLSPVHVDNLHPDLHHLIATVGTRLHRICNSRLDKLSSETNGIRIIQLCDDLLFNYHQITMITKPNSPKIQEKLEAMRFDIYSIIIQIKILSDLKLWDLELCVSITEPLITIRGLIEEDLKKVMKNGKI